MNNLPALRCHRDGDAQPGPKSLRPRAASNDPPARGECRTGHDDTGDRAWLDDEPLHAPLLDRESTLCRDLLQGAIEQAPVDARGVAVVQGAVYGRQRWEQLPGLVVRG